MIRGIHHVAVHVRDFDRMVRFYCEAFGFEDLGFEGGWSDNPLIDEIIDVPNSASRTTMLCSGNCYLEIFQYSQPRPDDSSVPLRPYQHGYTHFCVDVTDIETEVERLGKLGMQFERSDGRPGRAIDVEIAKAIYGRDPEGNLIELQETLPGCEFDVRRLPRARMAE
jgi:glyoxylase I family protein